MGDDPLVGRAIGHVQIEARLGAGGMAAVYVGRDLDHAGQRCALKLLSVASHEHIRERFRREALIGLSLRHPLLVGVSRHGTSGDFLYMVMELVEGEDLHDVLDRHGRCLPWPAVCGLGRDLGRAIAAMHERGVIHRDLKPANVLLDGRGGLKIADFGLARWRQAPSHLPTEAPLTITGDAFGTPVYMAPEQFDDAKTVGEAADLYALGVILYEALTGQLPFPAQSTVELARMHQQEPPPPIDPAQGPRRLIAIIDRLLAKDPAARPAPADVVEACKLLIVGSTPAATIEIKPPPGSVFTQWDPLLPPSDQSTLPPPARGRRRAPAIAALIGAIALPLLGWAAWSRPEVRRLAASPDELERFQAVEHALADMDHEGGPEELLAALRAYDERFRERGLLRRDVAKLWHEPQRINRGLYFVAADRARLARVPRGRYMVGADEPSPGAPALEARHEVDLPGLLIDRDEVSNARYRRFFDEWRAAGGHHRCGREDLDHGPPAGDLSLDPDGPVVGVRYQDALEYALFYGRRLPTSDEWAVAASWDPQDSRPRPYPWGKDPPAAITPFPANLAFASYGVADADGAFIPGCAPAGTFEFDRSSFGLRDVAGNASEWCAGAAPPPAPQPLRGGSLDARTAREALLAAVHEAPPDQPPRAAGFRTALTWVFRRPGAP
ncbi:MAG: bifunctional serine/threonine-protein kinase/formylglycine-generating enzyme family protein [Planctomycetota bacterium]